MPGYENAPATRQLATRCAICARPLVDAASVTAGIGPVCRQRHGYAEIPEHMRVLANQMIHKIARDGATAADKAEGINALRAMGLTKIVDKLIAFHATATITRGGVAITLKSKYSEALVAAVRRVPGRRYNRAEKVNVFPEGSGRALMDALSRSIGGQLCYGPKGAFVA